MQKEKRGIVYVATRREHYLAEAFLSAHSVKDFAPDLSITLFTDLPESPFATAPCFDRVEAIKTSRIFSSLWAEGQLDRITSLARSPYECTLHLDVDTRIMSDEFLGLFDKLEKIDVGMVICQPDVSKCARWTGFPMFNVGLILFRRNDKTGQLLEAWRELTTEHFHMANQENLPRVEYLTHIDDVERRRELLFMDQTSFVRLLSPTTNKFDVELEILEEYWNYRGTGKGLERRFDSPVRISHHPSLRNRLGGDIFERCQQYLQAGDIDRAIAILQCLHDELIPEENTDGKRQVAEMVQQLRSPSVRLLVSGRAALAGGMLDEAEQAANSILAAESANPDALALLDEVRKQREKI